MRTFFFTLNLLVLGVSVTLSHETPLRNLRPNAEGRYDCILGERFKDQCNHCTCAREGAAACTLMLCPDFTEDRTNNVGEVKLRNISRNADGKYDCIHKERFMDKCNYCICGPEGGAACTRMACPDFIENRPNNVGEVKLRNISPNADGTYNCTPKERFMDKCNYCFCDPRGIAGCTRMACPNFIEKSSEGTETINSPISNGEVKLRNISPNADGKYDCIPKERFMDKCNHCICAKEGGAACTLMACL